MFSIILENIEKINATIIFLFSYHLKLIGCVILSILIAVPQVLGVILIVVVTFVTWSFENSHLLRSDSPFDLPRRATNANNFSHFAK